MTMTDPYRSTKPGRRLVQLPWGAWVDPKAVIYCIVDELAVKVRVSHHDRALRREYADLVSAIHARDEAARIINAAR